MEHIDTHKLLKEGVEEAVKAVKEQPFTIIVKTDEEADRYIPDIEITIKTIDPCDCVVLAARVVALYKQKYQCDPVVELMPFLEDDE